MGSGFGSGYAINKEGHHWSKDMSKEVEMGLVKKTDSIEELAKKLGLPPEALAVTVGIKTWPMEKTLSLPDPFEHRASNRIPSIGLQFLDQLQKDLSMELCFIRHLLIPKGSQEECEMPGD